MIDLIMLYKRSSSYDQMSRTVCHHAERNKIPIFKHIQSLIGKSFLEVASGTGQHIDYFSDQCPNSHFYATDLDISKLHWLNKQNVSVQSLDLLQHSFSQPIDTLYCANLTHISPFEATKQLFHLAHQLQPSHLVIYGPFKFNHRFTTDSNREFHESLVQRNPQWGYRDISEIKALCDWPLTIYFMPANNFLLCFHNYDRK